MEDNVEERREEIIAELKAALAELEEGEGLSQFIVGHGLMSRLFEFKWSEPTLEINFSLPYARVLTDEDSQKAEVPYYKSQPTDSVSAFRSPSHK